MHALTPDRGYRVGGIARERERERRVRKVCPPSVRPGCDRAQGSASQTSRFFFPARSPGGVHALLLDFQGNKRVALEIGPERTGAPYAAARVVAGGA